MCILLCICDWMIMWYRSLLWYYMYIHSFKCIVHWTVTGFLDSKCCRCRYYCCCCCCCCCCRCCYYYMWRQGCYEWWSVLQVFALEPYYNQLSIIWGWIYSEIDIISEKHTALVVNELSLIWPTRITAQQRRNHVAVIYLWIMGPISTRGANSSSPHYEYQSLIPSPWRLVLYVACLLMLIILIIASVKVGPNVKLTPSLTSWRQHSVWNFKFLLDKIIPMGLVCREISV